jgi:hypothetical protein
MTQSAAPKHAYVRVGPLSIGTLIVRWPQGCDCDGDRRPNWPAVTGTLLAADDRAPARWLEAADVIVAFAGPGRIDPGGWLRRYPGCMVVAAWTTPDECSVATRNGVLGSVAVGGEPSHGGALACAMFVHGWLAARLPLGLLSPARLHVSQGTAVTWPQAGTPLFFRFGYCPVSGDDCPISEGGPSPGLSDPVP